MKHIKSLLLVLTLLASNAPSLFAGKLHDLIEDGNLNDVKEFLKGDGKKEINTLDKDDNTPLLSACWGNNVEMVSFLLQNGAKASINKPDKKGRTPLYWACWKNNLELVKLLLQNGAKDSINKPDTTYSWTPLLLACWKNNLELVKLLLQNGAKDSINTPPNINKETPLYWACYKNNLEIVKLLLQNGAKDSINTQDQDGETPLYRACFNCNLELVKFLLENGAKDSINRPDKYGKTPLICACFENNLEIVKLLLQKGAASSINTPNNNGNTPLYWACYNNNLGIVQLLLQNGADATIKTIKNNTPLSLICSQRWTTGERKQLLISLIPTELHLSQNAKIFIGLVIAALAEEMGQSATVSPKVPKNHNLFKMTDLVINPAAEIARIEEFVKILLFTPLSKDYNWENETDLKRRQLLCPASCKKSPDNLRLIINFESFKAQNNFFHKLLNFTEEANQLYQKSKKCLPIETQNQQEKEQAAKRSSHLHDIHFWFNQELFKKFVLSKTIKLIQEKPTVTFEDVTNQNEK